MGESNGDDAKMDAGSNGGDRSEGDEDEEDYIVQDEYASEFRIEKIADVRKVHTTG